MAEYLIQDTTLIEIGDAIRSKTGKTDMIPVPNLASEIDGIFGINFNVVGGTTQPANPSENTIWVNSTRDKVIYNCTGLNMYINSSTGVITTPSSNTCRIKYIECIAGHQYNFKLTDGQTVLIASFTTTPASGVTGSIIYGNGNTHGQNILDYTVTATSEMTYLAIWYYDGSANSGFPTLTITDLSMPDEAPEITGWIAADDEPANPVEGIVWIITSHLNPFASVDIIKSNNIAMIYPITVKQYINNKWVILSAKIYQNGAWIDLWSGDFYNSGEFSNIPHFYKAVSGSAAVTYGDSFINMSVPKDKVIEVYEIFGPVNLTGYNTLEAKFGSNHTINDSLTIYSCLAVASVDTATRKTATAIAEIKTYNYTHETIQLDISSLDDKKHLYVYAGFNTQGESWSNARDGCEFYNLKAR